MSMRRLPQGYHVCGATEDEIPALIAIDLAAGQMFAGTGLLSQEQLNDHVPEAIFRGAIGAGHLHTVRDQRKQLAGFALTSERGGGLHLDQISVDPAHGRKGLGAALIACVVEEARRRGAKRVVLSTFRDLPWNGPFYRRHGFREMPRKKMETWMMEIEAAQAENGLDIRQRCFMALRIGLL